MSRFLIYEKIKHHASESEVLGLAERLKVGDSMTIQKELGTGYFVNIKELEMSDNKGEYR